MTVLRCRLLPLASVADDPLAPPWRQPANSLLIIRFIRINFADMGRFYAQSMELAWCHRLTAGSLSQKWCQTQVATDARHPRLPLAATDMMFWRDSDESHWLLRCRFHRS